MPALDSRQWRRAGYIPISEAARALDLTPMALHRATNRGQIEFQTQGRFRFVRLGSLVDFIRGYYTDQEIATGYVARVRELVKIRHDPGARR